MRIENVGLIGAGLMGHGIARNILKHGYPLVFLAHHGNRPTEDLIELGASETSEVADLVEKSDVILLCVTGSPQVEEVVLGEKGINAFLKKGQIVADLSTVQPTTTFRVHEKIEQTGAVYVDIPMTRTPREAEAGKLNLLFGGDASVLETLRPLLGAFSENIYHAGPVGAGHALKLLHNFISLGNCALLAEAVACARKANVDISTFLEVLRTGGGDSVALRRLSPYITDRDEAGFLFTIGNCKKDMTYYTDMANTQGTPFGCADSIRALYESLSDGGNDGLPVPRMIDLLIDRD